MKTSFRRILSMLLALTMLLSMTGMTAFATEAEPLPTTLEAPSLLVYDSGNYTMDIKVKDAIEIFTDDDRIILQKYHPACVFCNNADNIIFFNGKRICADCLNQIKEKL